MPKKRLPHKAEVKIEEKQEWVRSPLVIIALALLFITIIYFLLVYKPTCKTQDCFSNALFKCSKALYRNEAANITWFYSIDGVKKDKCNVYAEIRDIKADAETINALKGKSMNCYIPKRIAGSFMPDEKLEYCHGLLKEDLQELIIQKMNLLIIQNIGQINKTA